MNVAYRWFIGYDLTEKLPDVSVIRHNRLRRYKNSDVPQQIFDEIVRQAMAKGLVGGKLLYSDSTHLKANANKNKYVEKQAKVEAKEYIDALNKAINAYPSLEIGFVSGLRETRFFVPLLFFFFCFLRGRYLRISGLSVRQRI